MDERVVDFILQLDLKYSISVAYFIFFLGIIEQIYHYVLEKRGNFYNIITRIIIIFFCINFYSQIFSYSILVMNKFATQTVNVAFTILILLGPLYIATFIFSDFNKLGKTTTTNTNGYLNKKKV